MTCLKFVKSFAAAYSSHSLFVIAHTSFWIRLFQQKTQTIGLKTWKWLRMEVIAFGISWYKLERVWNLQGWSLSRGVKHFYGITLAMNFDFSRISKTNLETSVEYLQKAFPQPSCLFFFLEQTTDRQIDLLFWVLRYPAHCTGLEFLPEPPQNKICHRLHPKYTFFSCLPIVFSFAVWKSLF